MSKIVYVPVEKINVEGMQTRAAIDLVIVREYAEAATTGNVVFPPVTLFKDTAEVYWLADGFHRFGAAKQTGQKRLAAEVREGSHADALRYALGANSAHGLRRTPADKAHAVKMAYEHRKELGLPDVPSARVIAEIVGVSDHFATDQLRTVRSWSDSPSRTGADGRTRELPPVPTRPPKNPPVVQQVTQSIPPPPTRKPVAQTDTVQVQTPAAITPPAAIPPPPTRRAKEVPPAGPVDCRGRHIPEDLLSIWNRRQEVQDLATAVSRVRVALEKAHEGEDPLWWELSYQAVKADLDKAFHSITSAQPWCVCPMCQGIGCRACSSQGFMSEYRFNQVVPADMRK